MFFVLSKIVYFFIAPSHLSLIVLGFGIILLTWETTQRIGRWLLMASFTAFIVLGFSPLGNALAIPLEDRFPMPRQLQDGKYSGIIFLGGFEHGDISSTRNVLALSEAAERISEVPRLAQQLPSAKVIFTGGSAAIIGPGVTARQAVEDYLRDNGIDAQRLVLESNSRNTWENAVFTRQLLNAKPSDRFLLVTSAWHMPRAMGVFRKVGYNVTAYPVDYRTRGRDDFDKPFPSMLDGLQQIDQIVKEWIGLAVYWITGRSNALFPAP